MYHYLWSEVKVRSCYKLAIQNLQLTDKKSNITQQNNITVRAELFGFLYIKLQQKKNVFFKFSKTFIKTCCV